MFVRLLLRRFVTAVVTVAAVSALVFFGINILPGNAAMVALGNQAMNPVLLHARERQFGLDQPIAQRYLTWLDGVVHGSFGHSLVTGEPVSSLIGTGFKNSTFLALGAILFLVPIAVGLGTLSALRRDKATDHGIAAITLTLLSTPEFVIGTLLAAALALGLGVLPAVSLLNPSTPVLSQWELLILPVLTLVLSAAGQTTRMIRAATIEVLATDYIEMAVLRGTPRRQILLRHVLPNALGPTIQVLAITVGALAGGVVIVETVFGYPGIGAVLVSAVSSRDIPTVTAIAVIIGSVYIFANLVADVLMMVLNPRLRRTGH